MDEDDDQRNEVKAAQKQLELQDLEKYTEQKWIEVEQKKK